MIYLIHFEKEYKGCCHYLGYTQLESVEDRLKRHRNGSGANLLRVLNENGIAYDVVRTWPGNKGTERKLKRRKNAKKLCPICNPNNYFNHAKFLLMGTDSIAPTNDIKYILEEKENE